MLLTAGGALAKSVTVNATVVEIDDEHKWFTFKTDDGKEVECKISSKRTGVKKGGKSVSRKEVKPGVKINITYKPDGDKNEPSIIKILE